MTKKSAYAATFTPVECQPALAPNSLNQAKIQPMKRARVAGIVVFGIALAAPVLPGAASADATDICSSHPPDDESVWDG